MIKLWNLGVLAISQVSFDKVRTPHSVGCDWCINSLYIVGNSSCRSPGVPTSESSIGHPLVGVG